MIGHAATLAGTQSESCSLGGDGGNLDKWVGGELITVPC